MILLAYILWFIKYIFIILIISYVSAFIKFLIAKISILKNSKILNKSLLRSTIFEALVIFLLTIPFFIKINQISIQNRYMLEKLISMSNTKAIKFFQMIIDNSSEYFLFFSNLYATIPFYFLISLSLFTIVLITKNGFKIFYSMPRNYISIFLLSTITPLIITSINFYYSYTLNWVYPEFPTRF